MVASSLGPGAAPSSRTARGAPPHGVGACPLPPASHGWCARELRQGLAKRVRDRGRARLAVLDGGPDPGLHAFEHEARSAPATIVDAEAAPAPMRDLGLDRQDRKSTR